MSDCIGLVCMTCSGRNPQYLHTVIHCPGCAENANLEQNQDEQIYELRHDRDLWHREHGKLHDENAQLRVQLAQRTAALERIASDHQNYEANGPGEYGIGVTDGHRCSANIARTALATLPDAPKEEEP
jgi:hypothetical protein